MNLIRTPGLILLILSAVGLSFILLAPTSGLAHFRVKPRQLNFAQIKAGQSSSTQVIEVMNAGMAQVRQIWFDGNCAQDWNIESNCKESLKPRKSCNIFVTFTPKAFGPTQCHLTIRSPDVRQRKMRFSGYGY